MGKELKLIRLASTIYRQYKILKLQTGHQLKKDSTIEGEQKHLVQVFITHLIIVEAFTCFLEIRIMERIKWNLRTKWEDLSRFLSIKLQDLVHINLQVILVTSSHIDHQDLW
jgi:hypothetical protein